MQWRNAGQSVVYCILKIKNPEEVNKNYLRFNKGGEKSNLYFLAEQMKFCYWHLSKMNVKFYLSNLVFKECK